jgi:hypothetical protein
VTDRAERFRAIWDTLTEDQRRFAIRLAYPSVRDIEGMVLLYGRGHAVSHTARDCPGPNARRIEFAQWLASKGAMREW